MVQSTQKVYKSWFQKLHKFEQLQISTGKSGKLKLVGLLSKKHIPSAKALYTVDLSNIIYHFNYLCEESPNYLCHF